MKCVDETLQYLLAVLREIVRLTPGFLSFFFLPGALQGGSSPLHRVRIHGTILASTSLTSNYYAFCFCSVFRELLSIFTSYWIG
ncbi:unnamed protein product, partial [Musa acuminata subsp. burmannicoides]